MTTLNRSQSALLVIDVQVGVVAEAYKRDQVVATIRDAVTQARSAGVPVIWVQHSEEEMPIDSDGWQIVPELEPKPEEQIIRKIYRSSFEDTNLEEVLAQANVGHLLVCGAESNNCLRHTSHTALERGYDVTLISDAHTTTGWEWNGLVVDAARVIDEQNGNFYSYQLPGRTAKAVPLEKIEF
ncbi:MAG: isochorismatase family protein [Micrococcales bacterium]